MNFGFVGSVSTGRGCSAWGLSRPREIYGSVRSRSSAGLCLFPPGKFIMTASSDTTILVWSPKGEVLASINTNQMNNAYAAVSPCGR